jgi:hypothetical protein
VPGLQGLDGVWSNREATALTEVPRRLLVLGGGPVGLELGQALVRMGASVAIVEGAERLLAREPAPVGEAVAEATRGRGVDVVVDTTGGPRFGEHLAALAPDSRLLAALPPDLETGGSLPEAIAGALSGVLAAMAGLRIGGIQGAQWETPADTGKLLEPGGVVGRGWRLRERCGSGYFGEVWLADHPTMVGVKEALKFVPKPEHAQLARREADRLIDLCKDPTFDFRHVVRLMDVYTGVPFLVAYEYLEGQSLADLVQGSRGRRLSPARTIDIGSQILEGLAHIHQAGYVHYDLHPGNVMILNGPARPHVKIVDFGLAWRMFVAGRRQEYSLALGAARPFAKAEPRDPSKGELPDARTDLYSVGLLLWLMLTGRWGLPDRGSLEEAWPRDHALLSLIRQACLVMPREGRYGSAREMLRDLQRVADWRPSSRSMGPCSGRSRRPRRAPPSTCAPAVTCCAGR